jgi:hypothetical protein
MNTNILALASALPDDDLLARLNTLANGEREVLVELLAHLAALDARPSLYAAQGCGSLFGYCTRFLRLSEDATCTRIEVARTCRKFPAVLELLATGALSLTTMRMLSPHLTTENHEAVLARATGRRRHEIEALVAELAPRPDVPSSVRKLPTPRAGSAAPPVVALPLIEAEEGVRPAVDATAAATPSAAAATRRPVIEATSPDRYRVQFTFGKESHDKLRRLQTLLRREIPSGDPAAIVDRALTLLLEKVEKAKLGAAARPRPAGPIRPGTDGTGRVRPSRDIPRHVQRAACARDGDQCGFVSKDGHRCTERAFLEFHHIHPHALGGPATVENISLRCRRHNQYEAELVFGRHGVSEVRERGVVLSSGSP